MPGTTDEATAGAASTTQADDHELVRRLLAGDDQTFRGLVEQWSPAMLRLARTFVGTSQSAEDVVQDAWVGVLRGLDRFEGRSSLRSWIFTIVVNRARTHGVREARTIVWSTLDTDDTDHGPTVDPARFQGPDGSYPGHWTSTGAPQCWDEIPERNVLTREAIALVEAALERLPPRQRLVVSLRDVDGLTAEEVCEALGITATNQRVLLHRGRATLRGELERYHRGG